MENDILALHSRGEVSDLHGGDIILSQTYDLICNLEMKGLELIEAYVFEKTLGLSQNLAKLVYKYLEPEIVINTSLFEIPYKDTAGYIPIALLKDNVVLSIRSVCGFTVDSITYTGIHLLPDDLVELMGKERYPLGEKYYVDGGCFWKIVSEIE